MVLKIYPPWSGLQGTVRWHPKCDTESFETERGILLGRGTTGLEVILVVNFQLNLLDRYERMKHTPQPFCEYLPINSLITATERRKRRKTAGSAVYDFR
jgi:hypothetical protein